MSHPIFADDMLEIVESFVIETLEIFEDLDQDLLQLETNSEDRALVDQIFRAVHTVKGTAGFLSLEQMSYLAHCFEDVLNQLRRGELVFHPSMMDVMFDAFDLMKVLLQQVIDQSLDKLDLDAITGQLKAISKGTFATGATHVAGEANTAAAPAAEDTKGAAAAERSAPAGSGTDVAVGTGGGDDDPPTPSADPTLDASDVAEIEEGATTILPVGASHPIFSEDMQEIVESFIVETNEIFEDLDQDLLKLESGPDDRTLVDQIFRAVHTVKGTAGFLSLERMSLLAHRFEDVLNQMRRGELDFHPSMMDVMFDAFDEMKVLHNQVVDRAMKPVDHSAILAKLKAISEGTFVKDASTSSSTSKPASKPTPKSTPKPASRSASTEAAPAAATPDSEPAASKPAPTKQADPAPKGAGAAAGNTVKASGAKKPPVRKSVDETIRVEVRRLDNLMDLVGELVLGRNRLLQIVEDIRNGNEVAELMRELHDTTTQVDFIASELQGAVMRTRMVQIGRVFNKFPRMIRDLSKEFDKQISLIIEGEETEVDKSLIEEISDPLVHLIRNACDHGVELPADRVAKGKPEKGTIKLTAGHEGNHIVISIEDDGGGIDVDRIKQKAVDKGMITEKDAAEMKEHEAFNLLFAPGLSTAKSVSRVSGRGVGMDVVKTNITRLNGTISVESELNKGSRFILKLPLTLAIIQSLLVRVEAETFAVPLHAVVEVVGLNSANVGTINGHRVIRIREEVLPLIGVNEMLDVRDHTKSEDEQYAVILHIAEHKLGLVVDQMIGQKEIVIKSLGSYLNQTPGIAGSTIMGDGRVILILDVAELVRMQTEAINQVARVAA